MAKRWLRIGIEDPSDEQYVQLAYMVFAATRAMDLAVIRFESDGRQQEWALESFWEDIHDKHRQPPWED
ncbi:hypothetical protein [Actinomadura sp. 3N508]|uniref:hypothetical protein n=1 Tax=Actinomadura sp. 3N508 TaxID=3375153 RepID=UPI0037AD36BF